ncbi:UNVERIFIED_CONTAM: hypothetical protein Sindi_1831900 [Sesamum indicum]
MRKQQCHGIPAKCGESENAGISSDSEKQSSAIGISVGNATVLLATVERRVSDIPQLADVAIVGDGDGELAVAVADDVEGDVTDDARMTSADITADITTDDITADITTDGITADAGMTASAVDVIDDVTLHKKTKKQFSNFSSFSTGLFVGNILLHACSDTIINDKIAHAFHNSTRKTLSYVAPTMQNGEVIVRPTLDIIRNGSKRWRATAVGYFRGKRPYFYHLKEFAMSVWPDMKEGQPIVLQKWEPGMVLRKLQHTQVPVWIKLRHLPVELWTDEGLSTVASGVGKPLYPDAITRACTKLDFARVCVMLDVTSNLPKHIIIMTPDEDGGESPCKVDVDGAPQEPTMPKRSRNHLREEGDTTYIPSRPTHMPDRNMSRPPPARVVEKQRGGRESPRDAAGPSREERAICNVRGLNKRDHQLAVKDIVAEFRLQFLGLLETRVRINNVSHIQAFLLPQWKWFVDYGSSGNWIWIAWDENFIDVDVVECGTQFIHCHVNIRALHESIAITVIYGANELVERRALWGSMETIAMQSTDIPWLVGGDFNTVRDLSEICGVSGDTTTTRRYVSIR